MLEKAEQAEEAEKAEERGEAIRARASVSVPKGLG
jgi:hypothetical protein